MRFNQNKVKPGPFTRCKMCGRETSSRLLSFCCRICEDDHHYQRGMKILIGILLSTLVILVGIFILTDSCHSEELKKPKIINVHITIAEGVALDPLLFQTISEAFSEINVAIPHIKLRRASVVSGPLLPYGTKEGFPYYLEPILTYFWRAVATYLMPLPAHKPNDIYLVIVPPERNAIEQPQPNGAALQCGELAGMPIAVTMAVFERARVSPYSDLTEARIARVMTKVMMQHELLHVLGAGHDMKYISVMTNASIWYISKGMRGLPIARQTKREVRDCQKKLGNL